MKIKVLDTTEEKATGRGSQDSFHEVDLADGKWVAKVQARMIWNYRPEDERAPMIDRPLVIPYSEWVHVLGVRRSEVICHLHTLYIGRNGGHICVEDREWWVVSDQPFAVVERYSDLQRCQLGLARQIHKGELGMVPELVVVPRVVTSKIEDPRSKDLKRPRTLNWVNLFELAQMTKLDPPALLRMLAIFSPSTYDEPNLPVLFYADQRNPNLRRIYTHSSDLPHAFCEGELKWGGAPTTLTALNSEGRVTEMEGLKEMWVLQRSALTALRLVQFGYQPHSGIPDQSLTLKVTIPQPPIGRLPDLSREELEAQRLDRDRE